MPRFHVGQKVLITDPLVTKYRWRQTTVISIQPKTGIARGADKYVVQFDDGDQSEFWDIQLMAAPQEITQST
jgi:hypothetical protein